MTDRMALSGLSKREAPPAKDHEVFVSGAVVKAAQAVSGEIILDRLIQTLMTLAFEHAGAERGLLILLRGDTPWIEAEARTEHKTVEVKLRQETVAPAEMPESLIRTVLRTQQSLILDDAFAPNPFSADAYLQQQRVRSVLCLPLLKQANPIGLLYLANSLASHVFTPARIMVLELLASQATISLENARLYADLTQENRERQTAQDAMRLSDARWRSLFENVPVGVALVGPHGRYVEGNPAFRKMTGYSDAELQHLTPPDITHEDDLAASRRSSRQAPRGRLNQWYFGMKAHFGVDRRAKVIHSVVATAANVHDSAALGDLLHGEERDVWGDQAYQGQSDVIKEKATKARDLTNLRTHRRGVVNEVERARDRVKSKVRSRVEHVIGVIKLKLGFTKVRIAAWRRMPTGCSQPAG